MELKKQAPLVASAVLGAISDTRQIPARHDEEERLF
jgi:hypothetical protein